MARPKRKRTIGPAEAARKKKAKTAAAAKAAKAKAAAQKAAAAEAAAASVGSSESEEEDLGQGEEVAMPSRYDDMDLPALIRAVFSLPADAQPVAIVDAAVSAADVDGLRKILRDVDAAVEPTKWDGMDFASLVRAAVLLPAAHSEAADVAIRASDAEALRQLLTENHQVAPAQARAKGMDPTRDAAEIQEMMARELKRAEGAATEEAKMQHKRSAEMLRAQIGAGDGPQGDSGQAESRAGNGRAGQGGGMSDLHPQAKRQHSKNAQGKGVCFDYQSDNCQRRNCKWSHHCQVCGDSRHGAAHHDVVGAAKPTNPQITDK